MCDLPTYYRKFIHIEIFDNDLKNVNFVLKNITYHTKSTLNNDKVRKYLNIVLVTIFHKFQN